MTEPAPGGEHTPTPWTLHSSIDARPHSICGGGHAIAGVWHYGAGDSALEARQNANAAYIVEAVNAHAGLLERVKLLKGALERLRDCDFVITPRDRMDAVREIARTALETSTPTRRDTQ